MDVKKLKLLVNTLLFSLLIVGCAQQSPANLKKGDKVQLYYKVPAKDGEFRKSWPPGIEGIACKKVPKQAVKEIKPGYDYCLRLGEIRVGDSFKNIQQQLHAFETIPEKFVNHPKLVNQQSNSNAWLIPLAGIEKHGAVQLHSYLVVFVDNHQHVKGLQVTGIQGKTTDRLHFSSVKLGMKAEKVVDLLGNPSSVKDVKEINGKLWSYYPFPFSIEFVQGKVYSIHIEKPRLEDLNKPFIAMQKTPATTEISK